MTATNTTKKIISSFFIILMLLPAVFLSTPKKAQATGIPVVDAISNIWTSLTSVFTNIGSSSTVVNTGLHIKDIAIEIGKQLLKIAAKRLLAKMTQATINWINSDFHGAPLFLENPESFFRDVAKSEVRNLVDMIGYDTFRFPFGPQTALNVIDSYKRQLADNAQYTLSKVINDPDLLVRYRNDFNYGGWNGFLINTQYPQNNYLGFEGIIQQNLASRLEGTLQAPAQKIQSLLQQGQGFLSPQTCPDNPKYNNGVNEFLKPRFKPSIKYVPYQMPRELEARLGEPGAMEEYERLAREHDAAYEAIVADEEDAFNDPKGPNVCPGGLVNTTPGSVAANQIFSAMNSPFLTTALDGALGNSLAAIFDALINKFLDDGLNALGGTISPAPKDNWSYNGNSLGGDTSVIPNEVGSLNIPQNVSIVVGETARTNISGGIAPYSIATTPNTSIATAQISVSSSSGPALMVKGINPGNTSFVVKDSSIPAKTTSISVATNAIGSLAVIPANISSVINNPIVANISGGEGPYFMRTSPNESIAIAVLSDTNIIVTGVAPGNTSVVIQDSSVAPKQVVVQITISDPLALTVSEQNVLAYSGQVSNTGILGGKKPYIVIGTLDPDIASTTIFGDVIAVTGKKPGETSVIFRDSSTSAKTSTVYITVINPLIVSPQNLLVNLWNSDQTMLASISGGTAPYNVIQTVASAEIATAQISGSVLTINAKTRGTTSLLVKDSSMAHPQTFSVNISVN